MEIIWERAEQNPQAGLATAVQKMFDLLCCLSPCCTVHSLRKVRAL
ncbi:MAG: hypothetical protein ACP5T0_04270 [Verrucomicrobiia bacterium]